MSLKGKNRAIFSYDKKDRSGSNFMYKDFEKTKSYRSNFKNAKFDYASLRAAHLKFCSFDEASFVETEFIGTNLRGSTFRGAKFKGTIFRATVLDQTNFPGATFKNCYFVATGVSSASKFSNNCNGITFLNAMPCMNGFSSVLIEVVEGLRKNDIIRRSNTLHLKQRKINTLSLTILLQSYSEDELIELLQRVTNDLTTQFYTLSYLKVLLKKAVQSDII